MNAMKLAAPLLIALAFGSSQALAEPILATSQSFAVLGASTVTNTGPTVINGDLGVSPGSAITGFAPSPANTIVGTGTVTAGPGLVSGTIYAQHPVALQAQTDARTAFEALDDLPFTTDLTGQVLGTGGTVTTLTPGVYSFSSSAQLNGALTLDFQGDADAFFVFQIGSTLTTASGSSVLAINGGPENGIYWQVGSSATLGTTTAFAGNILAEASVTLNTGASIACGRAFALTAAVNLDTNVISANCADTLDFGSDSFSGGLEFVNGVLVPVTPGATVPEPATGLLLGFGLFGLFFFRKRFFAVA
jgi:hypothetical protein